MRSGLIALLLGCASEILAQLPATPTPVAETQTPQALAPGARARVTLENPAGKVHYGKVVGLPSDSIILGDELLNPREYVEVAIARANVRAVHVSAGSRAGGQAMAGLALGAILGAVVGGLVGGNDDTQYGLGTPSAGTVGALGGAALGGLLGALIGATTAQERWVPARW